MAVHSPFRFPSLGILTGFQFFILAARENDTAFAVSFAFIY